MPETNRPKPVKYGRRTRMSYGKLKEVLPMPNLIDIQTGSYKWFLEEGLREVFDDFSPINDRDGKLSLEFVDYSLNDPPKYDQEECKTRNATYAAPLKVRVRLVNRETGEVKEQEVFMGDFPLMTAQGTFIYNGAERVIVTQLVRSPGVYFSVETDKSNRKLFSSQIIPTRGAWIEYETDSNGILYVHVDRKKKQPLTILLKSLGLGTNEQIINVFGADPLILKTLEKDTTTDRETALMELYHLQRPDDRPTPESAEAWLRANLFDAKRYDVAFVGRYKYNKKLGLANRITGAVLSRDVVDPFTGEILAEAGTKVSVELADQIENSGVSAVFVHGKGIRENDETKVIGNRFVDITRFLEGRNVNIDNLKIPENKVSFPILKEILDQEPEDDDLEEMITERRDELSPKHITADDIIASVSYLINLPYGIGDVDDIDHLGNRRLRTMGELLQNHFRIGLSRMERVIREKMATQGSEATTPQALINIRPVTAAVKEFFGSSQLSQFMDQNNPLSELTHKRRLSALGPGGLSRERAGFEVRDIHHSHYGRMCPIETPEGPNIGLIGSITTYAKINKYGFIETPYRIVDKKTGVVTNEVKYITADEEESLVIAQANEPLDEEGHFVNEKVSARGEGGAIALYPRERIDMMDVSPKQVVSVASAMIPFLEHDDANRALMGSNMQRQAVPLLVTEAPFIGTGIEYKAACDSGAVVLAKHAGTVSFVDAETVAIVRDDGEGQDEYALLKFRRSNQGTCINQRPVVSHGEHVEEGEVIADGPSTNLGEISLGKNLLIGFMTWEGYNYEDAVILNEKLIMNDVLTSIHVTEYETEARDTKLGPEEITNDIPNPNYNNISRLTEDGTIAIGTEVKAKDYLVGKVTPKGESDISPEERLLRAIFGEKAREVKDTSLTVPNGERGIVVDVRTFTRENGDELPAGVNKRVRCYIATKRKIQVGDKMSGRHGNKGVVSRILPEEDMPFLDDGTPLQMMLNPLGVPSRMNVGQVLEIHLGLAAKTKGWYIATPVFDGATAEDIQDLLEECGQPRNGKLRLRDGRTGDYFEKPVTVGIMYMLKLHHLVDDKIHARSSGSYSLVTQQPLGGKAQGGGQRFGEMEVWALEAYGAAYTLQEMLTVKSDDIVGRTKTYEMIEQGVNIPEPGIPESFKVLVRELRSLALDVRVFDGKGQEVELKEPDEDTGFRRFSRPKEENAETADTAAADEAKASPAENSSEDAEADSEEKTASESGTADEGLKEPSEDGTDDLASNEDGGEPEEDEE